MKRDALTGLISDYRFTDRAPLPDQVFDALIEKPRILERRKKIDRVSERTVEFVHMFEDAMG